MDDEIDGGVYQIMHSPEQDNSTVESPSNYYVFMCLCL